MVSLIFVSSVLMAASALAAPNLLEPRKFDCKDKLVVDIFAKHSAEAEPFCSSYLRRPAKKTTTTTVTTTITPPPKSVTTTVPVTFFDARSTTVTTPGDPITYFYNAPYPSATRTILPTPPTKRDSFPADVEARDQPLPAYCSGYVPSQVFSACSCLPTKHATTTVTSIIRTTLPPSTTTITQVSTIATFTQVYTSFVEGPRASVTVCHDYESDFLNAGYEYLNQGDVDKLTSLNNVPIYSGELVECCNLCYETENCVAYRFHNDHSVATCQRWTTPGSLPIVGYNQQCRAGIVNGTRQLITEKDYFGNTAHAIAIGPCMNADWINYINP